MLRRTSGRCVALSATCVPHNFVYATDLAFYFARFQPRTHIGHVGLPEVDDAVALLQPSTTTPRWCTTTSPPDPHHADARDRALSLLERGIDICNGLGGAASHNATVVNMLRPLYATRFELLNGVEHLPRCDAATRVHVHRAVLHEAGRLLYYNDVWDRTSRRGLDTSCVIVAHFIRALCALRQRPFHAPDASTLKAHTAPPWSLVVDGPDDVLTLPLVLARVEELLELSCTLDTDPTDPNACWTVPKLLVLKALVVLMYTGDLVEAEQLLQSATTLVRDMPYAPRHDDAAALPPHRAAVPELGLFLLVQAELAARGFDWRVESGRVDEAVMRRFTAAMEFYAAVVAPPSQADAPATDVEFEVQAHGACGLSYAVVLLNAPRPAATRAAEAAVFLPGQVFTLNPLLSVAAGTSRLRYTVHTEAALPVEVARRRTGELLERGLQLNRHHLAHDRRNVQAAWTLLTMACLYADTRDYLYATGLYESAKKALVYNYGAHSLELVLWHKLRYEYLAGVGSEAEAKTASHEVVHLLKQLDQMPWSLS